MTVEEKLACIRQVKAAVIAIEPRKTPPKLQRETNREPLTLYVIEHKETRCCLLIDQGTGNNEWIESREAASRFDRENATATARNLKLDPSQYRITKLIQQD